MLSDKQSFEFEIEGRHYLMNYYPVDVGLNLAAKLVAVVGGPMSRSIEAFKGQIGGGDVSLEMLMNSDVKFSLFGDAIKELALNLSQVGCASLVAEILQGLMVLGNKSVQVNYKEYFKGDYGHLIKVLVEVVSRQLGSFLGAYAGFKAPAPAANVQAIRAQ